MAMAMAMAWTMAWTKEEKTALDGWFRVASEGRRDGVPASMRTSA